MGPRLPTLSPTCASNSCRQGDSIGPVSRRLGRSSHSPTGGFTPMRAAPVGYLVFLALQLGRTESPAQSRRLVPVGDYHTHLLSESAAKLLWVPTLPAVELPAEIDQVIRQWERATKAGDPSSLTALFTADGLLGDASGWVRGSEAIRAAAVNSNLEDLRG